MIEFKTTDEFWSFVKKHDRFIKSIEEISSDTCIYMYLAKSNEVLYFNFNQEYGWLNSFMEAKLSLGKKNIDLRSVLSRHFGGIQYSRNNYLEAEDDLFSSLEDNEEKYMDTVIDLLGKQVKFEEIFASDAFLDQISQKLNNYRRESIMEYELPLLFLFVDYAKRKYSNTVSVTVRKNQFGEKYRGLFLHCNQGNDIDLSEIVFRVLYPDYLRDDFENDEEVKVDLVRIKEYIDYHNSKRFLKIEN